MTNSGKLRGKNVVYVVVQGRFPCERAALVVSENPSDIVFLYVSDHLQIYIVNSMYYIYIYIDRCGMKPN